MRIRLGLLGVLCNSSLGGWSFQALLGGQRCARSGGSCTRSAASRSGRLGGILMMSTDGLFVVTRVLLWAAFLLALVALLAHA